jgi:hypothetical protein
VVHFAWARKGNLAGLSGDILLPLAFGAVALGLLSLRLPVIRRRLARRPKSSAGKGAEVQPGASAG